MLSEKEGGGSASGSSGSSSSSTSESTKRCHLKVVVAAKGDRACTSACAEGDGGVSAPSNSTVNTKGGGGGGEGAWMEQETRPTILVGSIKRYSLTTARQGTCWAP